MATFAIVGVSRAVIQEQLSPRLIDEAVVRLLCMTGIGEAEALEVADRPRPALGPESRVF